MPKPSDLLDLISTQIRGQPRQQIERILKKLDLFVAFDTHDTDFTRLLIKSSPGERTFHFNGVIFRRSGRLLCVPMRRLVKIATPQEFLQNDTVVGPVLHRAEVNCAVNGTVINVYFDGDVMCISTSRGIDVSHLAIIGDLTYRDILIELLNEAGLTTDVFRHDVSYTFVISHPAYHWLKIRSLTFIGAFDLSAGRYLTALDEPQLARLAHEHRTIPVVVDSPNQGLTTVQQTASNRNVLAQILHETTMTRLMFMNGYTHDGPAARSPPFFGFIVRSHDTSVPDYYIESDLMQWLRETIYTAYRQDIVPANRWEYIKLSLYLSYTRSDLVRKAFVDYDAELGVFFDMMDRVVIPNLQLLLSEYQACRPRRADVDDVWYGAVMALAKRQIPVDQVRRLDNIGIIFNVLRHSQVKTTAS